MRSSIKWLGLAAVLLVLDGMMALAQSVDTAPLFQVEGVLQPGNEVVPDDGGLYETYTHGKYSLTAQTVSSERQSSASSAHTSARQDESIELNNQGQQLLTVGRFEEARVLFERALVIVREIEERQGEGVILTGIGIVYANLGQYEQALKFYGQALAIQTEIGDRRGERTTLSSIGEIYVDLGQYERALECYEQALAIATEITDSNGEGFTLTGIGSVYDNLGQYERALGFYEQALAIQVEIGDRRGEGITISNIGLVYDNLGQYERALGFYEQALAIQIEIGDRRGEGVILNNMGWVYRNLGQYERALEYFEQALAIRIEVDHRLGEGATLSNIGVVYRNLGQYERALGFYEQALAIQIEIGDRIGQGGTLNNIGTVYYHLGQYERASESYEQALAIQKEIGDRRGLGQTLSNIGSVYNPGQYERALEFYEQALAIQSEIGDRQGVGQTLNKIGAVYDSLGQYERALESYEHVLAISTEIGDRRGKGTTLHNIGVVYRNLGQYERALEFYEQALAISTEIGDREGEAITLNNIGSVLETLEEPELAIVFLKQSVNRYEAIRGDIRGLDTELQQSFTDSVSSTYRTLADLLLQADRVLEAQRVLDLLKVQELEEYLQDVQRNAQTEDGIELLDVETQIQALRQAITNQAIAIGEELTQLRQIDLEERTPEQMARIAELEAMQAEVIAQFEDFIYSDDVQALVAQLSRDARQQDLVNELDELITIQDTLRALEQNAVLLYPLILDDRIELVLVTPNSPPARYPVTVERGDLNAAIVEFRQALESPNSRPEAIAQQLYEWLIQPLAADLEAIDAETILYAPDGVLRYIPLAALHDGNQWLAQRFRINHITAASLTNLNLEPAIQPEILAAAFSEGFYEVQVGDRTFPFDGLPFAGQEVENLAAFPGTTKLLNTDFNPETTVPIMDDHTIVHLATHAEFVQGTPADSFIVFGNGDRITLEEIKQWRGRFQQVDLMVLSACETGLGDTPGNGEEILGFGYLMQQAGARAAIASLWSVSDGGTQVLMDAFYTALNNGYSKAEALQRAQIALIRNDSSALEPSERGVRVEPTTAEARLEIVAGSELRGQLNHPYYWAPFILIGNGL